MQFFARFDLPPLFTQAGPKDRMEELDSGLQCSLQREESPLVGQDGWTMPEQCLPTELGTVFFVVDCQPVCLVVGGRAPLTNDFYRPIFTRICRHLLTLLPRVSFSANLYDDPVLWFRREQNKLADALCNYTMDIRCSWQKV